MAETSWTVTTELDGPAFKRLGNALRSLGYVRTAHSWGVGGSVELSQSTHRGPKGTLEIEVETYTGLTVIGQEDSIRELQMAYEHHSHGFIWANIKRCWTRWKEK
uniref:hypothetical protein n=1 Tax=Castellaniella defragrans TaxID=75697 RepID=UPI0033424DBD